jgi:ABC-type sugar transport system ATPase subunit
VPVPEQKVDGSAPGVPQIELVGVGKRYGGIQALADVNLTIKAGSIHALVGENGAGKSTLGKIIGGVIPPSEGKLKVDGEDRSYAAPRDALHDGITVISQEVTLLPERSVIENVFLGNEDRSFGMFVRRGALEKRYAELVERAGFDIPGKQIVSGLRVADQQKVEVLRAIVQDARLIVMDEPTAALSPNEIDTLFQIVRRLNAGGTTIIYVSHFLNEVLDISDTVSVLKDGKHVRTAPSSTETPASLITSMLGRPLSQTFPPKAQPDPDAEIALEVEGLCRGVDVDNVSFAVRRGEIVGLAGLVGSGRTETVRLLFGAERPDAGVIKVEGREVKIRTPRHAVDLGIGMLPESRKEQALIMDRSLVENVTLAHLEKVSRAGFMFSGRDERRRGTEILDRVGVRGAPGDAPVSSLSGGNQQKVVFARWLFEPPRILIADEPTRGVDIGAKTAIYELLATLAASGIAIIIVSSEIEEVLGISHRILVMRAGGIVAELGHDATEDSVLNAAFGQVEKVEV